MLRTSQAQLLLMSQSDASPFGPARKIHYNVVRVYTVRFIATFSKRQALSHHFSLLLLKTFKVKELQQAFWSRNNSWNKRAISLSVCFYVLENIYASSSRFPRFVLTFSKALRFCQRPERFATPCFIWSLFNHFNINCVNTNTNGCV